MVAASGPADPLFAGRVRVMMFASDVAIVLASVVFALVAGNGWAWGPAVCGVAVVAAAVACNLATFALGMAVLKPTDANLRRARDRQRGRSVVIIPAYFAFAAAFGLIAGSLRSYWPDVIAFVIFFVTAVAFPLAMLPRLKRRASEQRVSCS